MTTTKQMIEHAVELYNAGDVDAFLDLYADDAVLTLPEGTFRRREAIRRSFVEQWTGFPDSHISAELIVAEGDTIAEEFTYQGTNTGPVAMPDGSTLPASGRHVEMKAMQLIETRAGKVVRHDIFLDTGAMVEQMGWSHPGTPAT